MNESVVTVAYLPKSHVMRNILLFMTAITLIAGLTACGQNQAASPGADADIEKEKTSIRQQVDKFMLAFKAKDSLTLASFYTSDGLLLPPNSPPVTKEQSATMWGYVFRLGLSELKLTINDISGDALHLIETGEFEMYAGSNKVDNGKYLVVWKKENGQWKMFRDMWNTSQPLLK